MKLNDKLNTLNLYPFHMPGHKRNEKFNITGSMIDITEIDGFDNLHNPKEIILDMEDKITEIFNSKKSIISVNGSTCCVLSAISAVCDFNDDIIIARNCHKSVYNACYINRLNIHYIEPEYNERYGIYTNISQNAVDNAIKNCPNAKAIVITSPTYEGFVSNITAEIPVIIDSAHGSHLGLADYLPKRMHADIVINSLHKTLPALTQTACVHIYNEKYIDKVKRYMDIYETSSPSYVLLASVDRCIDFLTNCSNAFFEYKNKLDAFYNKANEIKNISFIENDDITRICISADGYSGYELCNELRKRGIEPEGYGLNYAILISTVCDTDDGFNYLLKALGDIQIKDGIITAIPKPSIPKKICNDFDIKETEITSINDAIGKVCAENIFAYPPASPIIAVGELISNDTLEYIKMLRERNINLLSDSNLLPNSILTKAE